MFKISNSKFILASTLLFLITHVYAEEPLTQNIVKIGNDLKQVKQGEKLFNAACSGCHKKDLSGAMGFNLKDGEWVHGSSPSEVFNSISNGFSKAGMPAFKGTYDDIQRKQITAYVLSKREGWDNLSYKIFQLPTDETRSFDILNNLIPIKKGSSHKNIADFSMPETKEFGVIFEGDFYTYNDKDTILYGLGVNPAIFVKLEIDGKEVPFEGDWSREWPLKRGKQKLKLTFVTPQTPWPKWTNTNVKLFVSNPEKTIKFFPASTRGKQMLNGTTVEVKANTEAIVHRKKVVDLPPYTISVGLPEKINYGFNTRSCAIEGVWKGEMLNIGPNVKGRGQDGSIILGDWIFKSPETIQNNKSKQCEFIKYTRETNPEFHYRVDGITYRLQALSSKKNELTFNYKVLENTSSNKHISIKLPKSSTANISSEDGVIKNNTLSVKALKNNIFSIQVAAKGDE